MKKYLFLLIASLSITSAFSQDFGFGVRAGLNYSSSSVTEIFEFDDSLRTATITGLSGAAIFDFPVKKYFSIQPEIRYGQVESSINSDTMIVDNNMVITDNSFVFDKIEVPILAKLRFGSDVLKINLFAGPNFGFTVKGKELEIVSDGSSDNIVTKTKINNDLYETYDYSNVAGFGLSLIFNDYTFFADYRYNFDFKQSNSTLKDGVFQGLGANVGGGFIVYW